jgi:hypothetical protein
MLAWRTGKLEEEVMASWRISHYVTVLPGISAEGAGLSFSVGF